MNPLVITSIVFCAAFFATLCYTSLRKIELKKQQLYPLTAMLILAFGVIAFYSKPYFDDDLARYYDLLNDMQTNGLGWTLKESIYSTDFVINLFFYIIAKTGIFRLLPFFSVIIIYSLFFSSIYKSHNFIKAPQFVMVLFIVVHFAFMPFRWTLSGIRNYIAFAIFAYAVYREFILKKRGILTVILYLAAVFTHFSLAFFLLARILCIPAIYSFVKRWRFAIVGWGLISGVVGNVLQLIPIEFVQKVGIKLSDYFLFVDFDVRKTIARFALFLVIFAMYFALKKYNKEAMEKRRQYYIFMEITLFMIFGSLFIPLLFDRSASFLVFVSFPLFVDFFRCAKKETQHIFFVMLSFLTCGMVAYQAVDAINYWRFYP